MFRHYGGRCRLSPALLSSLVDLIVFLYLKMTRYFWLINEAPPAGLSSLLFLLVAEELASII